MCECVFVFMCAYECVCVCLTVGLLDEGAVGVNAGAVLLGFLLAQPQDVLQAVQGHLHDLGVHHRQQVTHGLDGVQGHQVPGGGHGGKRRADMERRAMGRDKNKGQETLQKNSCSPPADCLRNSSIAVYQEIYRAGVWASSAICSCCT